jgi:hypothetical protein
VSGSKKLKIIPQLNSLIFTPPGSQDMLGETCGAGLRASQELGKLELGRVKGIFGEQECFKSWQKEVESRRGHIQDRKDNGFALRTLGNVWDIDLSVKIYQ